MFVNVNGFLQEETLAGLKISDRGLTLGVGLFETIKIEKSTPVAFNYHWQRLDKSASLIGLKLPFSRDELKRLIHALINKNKLLTGGLRLTLTEGESPRGIIAPKGIKPNFFISTFELASLPQEMSATVVSIRRNEKSLSSQIKSISYLDNVLAKKEALEKGFDEAILLNSVGNVSEGATTNIFARKGNVFYTPLLSDGALAGIMRRRFIERLQGQYLVKEESLTLDFIKSADEVFLTNALIGVRPLVRLDEKFFKPERAPGQPHECYFCVQSRLK